MRLFGGIVAICLMASLSTAAFADDVSDAKAHFRKGTAAYALGHYGDAATEWEAAFALQPDPALLYNAAQAHRLAGNHPRALQLYQSYLRLYASQVKNQDEVKRHIAELQRAIATQEQASHSPPTTPVPVTSQPSTAPSVATRTPAQEPPPSREPATAPPTTTPPEPATTTAPPTQAPSVVASAPPPAEHKPIYKKTWFWVTVGAAVVVVGVGVGLGVGLSGGSSNPTATFGKVSF
jgi:tetratricopeptide (TPR) repeat protein